MGAYRLRTVVVSRRRRRRLWWLIDGRRGAGLLLGDGGGLVIRLGRGLRGRAVTLDGGSLVVRHGRGLGRRAVSRSRDRGGLILDLSGAFLLFFLGLRLRDGYRICRLGLVDRGRRTNAAAAAVVLRIGLHNGKAGFPLASPSGDVGMKQALP